MSFVFNIVNKVNETFKNAGSFNSDIGMFSGFTALDVASSSIEQGFDLDLSLLNGGMFNKPYNEIGLSSVGKTTLWIQVISSCIDKWYEQYGPVSECLFYNVEQHTSPQRWMNVTGYTEDMMRERVRFVTKPMSIIEIFNDIAAFAKCKIDNRKQLEVVTPIRSLTGEPVKALPTTYVLIDSIASIRSKTDISFDKEGNIKASDAETIAGTSNMDAMQLAKDNTIFINEIKKLCEEARICVISINHLVEVPVLDRYNPPKPVLPALKYNQKLKGGNEFIYQSFAIHMLSIKERLYTEKNQTFGNKVHGIISILKWLKNKNGPEGIEYPMVFDYETGYKPELSDFELLYSEGGYGISGSPLSYHLDILPEITFTRKTLLQKCEENPILARALSFTTRLYLVSKLIKRTDPVDITNISNELDYYNRISLIMNHSTDYPGYVNRGLVPTGEDIEKYYLLSETVNNKQYPNKLIDETILEEEIFYEDMLKLNNLYNINSNKFKITTDGIEYVAPVGENAWK